jgi:hypothetical protein
MTTDFFLIFVVEQFFGTRINSKLEIVFIVSLFYLRENVGCIVRMNPAWGRWEESVFEEKLIMELFFDLS